MFPVIEPEAAGEAEVIEAKLMPVGDIVDVATPLKLVTIATVTGLLAGIIEVDAIDRPGTVAEMTMPTVAHSFWANIKAPNFSDQRICSESANICPNEPAWSEASHCASM